MTEAQIKQKFKETYPDLMRGDEPLSPYFDIWEYGIELATEELQDQIEKMKNWCNCKNYQQCLIELAEQGKGMKPSECCVNCKKWELSK